MVQNSSLKLRLSSLQDLIGFCPIEILPEEIENFLIGAHYN